MIRCRYQDLDLTECHAVATAVCHCAAASAYCRQTGLRRLGTDGSQTPRRRWIRTSSSAPNRQRLASSEMRPIDRWQCTLHAVSPAGTAGAWPRTANVDRDYSDGCPARRRDPRCRLGRSARHPAAMAGLARARQTPNPVSDDRDRSVRLSPWLRRRGSRSCDTPMAGARRPCSPARPGERRRHPSAVEAPIRLRGSVPSAGGEGGSDRAFCRQGRLRSSSRPSSRRTGPGQPCHATRQRESPVRSSSASA